MGPFAKLFFSNEFLLIPLKILANQKFSNVFRGIKRKHWEEKGWNGLINDAILSNRTFQIHIMVKTSESFVQCQHSVFVKMQSVSNQFKLSVEAGIKKYKKETRMYQINWINTSSSKSYTRFTILSRNR